VKIRSRIEENKHDGIQNRFAFQALSWIAVEGDPDDALTRRTHSEPPHSYRTPFAAMPPASCIPAPSAAGWQKRRSSPACPPNSLRPLPQPPHHTLEVTQIARTLAASWPERGAGRGPRVGPRHRPSALWHAGEKALDEALQAHGLRFDHNLTPCASSPGLKSATPPFAASTDPRRPRRHRQTLARLLRRRPPRVADYFLSQFPRLKPAHRHGRRNRLPHRRSRRRLRSGSSPSIRCLKACPSSTASTTASSSSTPPPRKSSA